MHAYYAQVEKMAQKCKKERKKLPPSPPTLNLKVLKRYQDLKEKGKFLDLDIKCFDELGLPFTRKVHKYVLNSISCLLTPFLSFSSPGIIGLRHSEFGSLCTEAGVESITFPTPRGGINSTPGMESIPHQGWNQFHT